MATTTPKVCLIKTDGTNCDEELKFAFELAGAKVKTVHVNELRNKTDSLKNYQILGLPGGFSYGDDVASGKILAIELSSYLSSEIKNFVDKQKGLVIGICNGFQTLVRTGLLPYNELGKMSVTLTDNDCAHFVCRPINLNVEKNHKCVFLQNLKGPVTYYTAHGEGKFMAPPSTLSKIESEKLVVFRYADINPNGSPNNIAGITDTTGHILGLMPHPERAVLKTQFSNWRRNPGQSANWRTDGLFVFKKMVEYFK